MLGADLQTLSRRGIFLSVSDPSSIGAVHSGGMLSRTRCFFQAVFLRQPHNRVFDMFRVRHVL